MWLKYPNFIKFQRDHGKEYRNNNPTMLFDHRLEDSSRWSFCGYFIYEHIWSWQNVLLGVLTKHEKSDWQWVISDSSFPESLWKNEMINGTIVLTYLFREQTVERGYFHVWRVIEPHFMGRVLFVTKERKKPLAVMFALYYVTGMVFMYFLPTCGTQHHDYIFVRRWYLFCSMKAVLMAFQSIYISVCICIWTFRWLCDYFEQR